MPRAFFILLLLLPLPLSAWDEVSDARDAELSAAADIPSDAVVVDLHERAPAADKWPQSLNPASIRYTQPTLAFIGLPKKYTATGVIDDWTNPLQLRARTRLTIPAERAGTYELILRAWGAVRLYVDGKLALETKFLYRNANGDEAVPELVAASREDLRPLPADCQEQRTTLQLDAGEHIVRLDAFVGGKGLRLQLDELCVAMARPNERLALMGPGQAQIGVTEEEWQAHVRQVRNHLDGLDSRNRQIASADWRQYWQRRHEFARQVMDAKPPLEVPSVPASMPTQNDIDRIVGAKLVESNSTPSPLTDDYAFLRRATLDTTGVVPSREEIARYMNDDVQRRRNNAIDHLLDDPRWADHGVAYWQDVLAENPGILKPELNNTGPFRWWIHESLLDNKPFDQFATELVLMQGSVYYGGPAGFGLATQNDVPMAAKAHVLAKAFLAMDLTCARCHDAPYHPFKQQELFNVAAMLSRKPIKLPATSTVPLVPGARQPLVTISLKPGEEVAPEWPFGHVPVDTHPQELLRNPADTREQVALQFTSPLNDRFAKVLVNRVWQRLMGRGLVDPVDDWEATKGRTEHPGLLEFLAREFVRNGYDLKHIQRLIMKSHVYQRAVIGDAEAPPAMLFAAPMRRRMTAEQIVDALFAVSGKPFRAERLTLDPEGRRPVDGFLDLGTPRRAWHFTSLSNERDRPALALPVAQSVVDLLVAFGWRDARPNPLTYRDEETTAIQPLSLANGVAGNRAVRLSDDNVLTEMSLRDIPVEQLVQDLFLQILSRPPSDDERGLIVATLADGYELRRTAAAPEKKKDQRNAVSWSNHLSAEATRIKRELEREVQAGDPPTSRLQSQWRERIEDVVWALINSPEFVFVP